MDNELNNLNTWLLERPGWLQIAAKRLYQNSALSDVDIAEMADFCLQEVEGCLPEQPDILPASIGTNSSQGELRLCAISDINGVNALAPRNPLEFGNSNFSIVYGNNGSGKTGYVRLLKQVCGARNMGKLHPNVYKKNSTEQGATISFIKGGVDGELTWTGEGICEVLKGVKIFDSSFGNFFVSSEDEVSYEPPILSFFSSLIEICEKVTAILDAKINKLQSKKPSMPNDMKATPEGAWYESINQNTTEEDIEKFCSISPKEDSEITILQQRISEQSPADKAKQLLMQKQHIDLLIQDTLSA